MDRVLSLVWNESERRPRSPVRLAGATLLVATGGLVGLFVAAALAASTSGLSAPAVRAVATTIEYLAVYLGVAGAVLVAGRYVDRRSLRDVGVAVDRRWLGEFGVGVAVGTLLATATAGVGVATGLFRVVGVGVTTAESFPPLPATAPLALALVATIAFMAAVAVAEELFVRGYLLRNLAEGLAGRVSRPAAVALATGATSVLFGVGHGWNPAASPLAVVVVSGFGLLLAAGFLLTGRLAIPIGIHAAWNVSIASVFGFPVSGLRAPVALLALEASGPEPLTGGAFGPEGGLLALGTLPLGVLALLWWARWRGVTLALSRITTPSVRGGAGSPWPCRGSPRRR